MKYLTHIVPLLAVSLASQMVIAETDVFSSDVPQHITDEATPMHRHVHRLMQRIKEHDPDEYDRLEQLREDNPDAFHQALREKLQKHRKFRRQIKDYPEMQEAFRDMPSPRQELFMDALGDGHQKRGNGRGIDKNKLELHKMEREAQELARAYRHAVDDDAREEILGSLREHLSRSFDMREARRKQAIAHMESKLHSLKESLDDREASRNKIIENRINQLTGEDPLKW